MRRFIATSAIGLLLSSCGVESLLYPMVEKLAKKKQTLEPEIVTIECNVKQTTKYLVDGKSSVSGTETSIRYVFDIKSETLFHLDGSYYIDKPDLKKLYIDGHWKTVNTTCPHCLIDFHELPYIPTENNVRYGENSGWKNVSYRYEIVNSKQPIKSKILVIRREFHTPTPPLPPTTDVQISRINLTTLEIEGTENYERKADRFFKASSRKSKFSGTCVYEKPPYTILYRKPISDLYPHRIND